MNECEVVAAAVTDVGRVRRHNEDSHLVDTDDRIFMVADGMGGHAAGEVASAIAVRRVREAWTEISMRRHLAAYARHGDADARRALFRAVREGVMSAHFDIVEQASRDEAKRGMGTTFTGFLLAGGDAVFAHAGDSRAYLVRDGIAMQLSEDHTVIARLRAAGVEEEAPDEEEPAGQGTAPRDRQRWRGVLTNALGIGDVTRVATFAVPLYSGDRFLLCSDGVSEYLGEAELGPILTEAASPALAARGLVDLALERGGADNATAVVVKVLEAGETVVPREQRDREADALARCPLFEPLTPQERLRALRITTPREIKPGRELPGMALGDRVAYVVIEGEVVLASGDLVGPSGLVYPEALVAGTGSVRPAAATSELTRLLVIRRADFHELAEEESDLGVKLYAALAGVMVRD
ncbi:MAG TPA: protein phosphatase 2C domain-containing protein [Kofleriaceae bacterium]|nr:protein phosphatase 2C domain-containing protein [Kofleriaceae bacterium]